MPNAKQERLQAERVEKLRGQMDQAMALIKERNYPFDRLSAVVLVERDEELGLILIGDGGHGHESRVLVNSLMLNWPEPQVRDGDGRFLGMEILPLWLGSMGIYTPETLDKVREFLREDGRIVHVAGYDCGLAEELNPDYQAVRKEVESWFGQDLSKMISEMSRITNEDYKEACALGSPARSVEEGGFADSHLRAFVNFAFNYQDFWSSDLRQLYQFVRSRLVGRSGHPRDEEIFRLATNDDVDGHPPFEVALLAKGELDKMRYHELSREIIGGLNADLLTLLAPEGIRQSMMSNILKGRYEMAAEHILWFEAVRKLVLEYQKSEAQA
ncbi:hypothetical protein A3D09_01165 [Candidatus Collierbacteria bacterium RIFCSPHIGHO2_02_FULL_49_10]|uniref:Uncharacterized protein n=1 Tax=Candidatus Collierbacteria bacterium RIFCSPHIGHO2_02_FULL_49_10 TaxID=1817723 RepID=A0A1F5EVQ4_9BACT|nr:MAG: hypothetical protein A3D09_01165 [Candidatus Collierbacteria bacterium RIFCSPHIGHO2_02_FULL_49_10]